MVTPKTWTDRAADILLDERNKRYLGMPSKTNPVPARVNVVADTPTNPSASKDVPQTAAGRALLERLEDAEWRCVHWDDVAYTLPQRILAIEAEAAADPVVVRIHHGDSDAYARAYNTGYDDAMEHAAADPSGLVDEPPPTPLGMEHLDPRLIGTADPSGLTSASAEAEGLRAALDALDALDMALDADHPEGHGCDVCNAADDLRAALANEEGE